MEQIKHPHFFAFSSNRIFIAALALIFLVTTTRFLGYKALRNLENAELLVDHTYKVKTALLSISRQLVESQLTQRRYILWDEPGSRESMVNHGQSFIEELSKLKLLIADDPDQQEYLASQSANLQKVHLFLNAADRRGSTESVKAFDALIEEVKMTLRRMEAREDELLEVRIAKQKDLSKIQQNFAIALSIILILSIFAIAWTIYRAYQSYLQFTKLQQEATKLAEYANKAKSSFVANVTHELRTPLTSILGFADVLVESSLSTSDRFDAIQTIRKNGQHLLGLINDILDLSKIEAAQLDVKRQKVNLLQLIAEVGSVMRERVRGKNISVLFRNSTKFSKFINTDPLRLRQIMVNLLGNAIKFTEQGAIVVGVDVVEDKINFTFTDTGVGIAEDDQKKLFSPFFQGTNPHQGGTGLGLAISSKICELLGGSLSVLSKKNSGSAFTASIEYDPIGDEIVSDISRELIGHFVKESVQELPIYEGRVFLVEDSPDSQKLIERYLKRMGLNVTISNNGRTAVDVAIQNFENREAFDLILMDMQLPHLDGYSAVGILRERCYDKPVVALTANALEHDRKRAFDAGCDDFLAKPLDLNKMVEVFDKFLTRRDFDLSEENKESEEAIVRAFERSLKDRRALFLGAIQANDLLLMQTEAHKLAGVAGMYGYPEISAAALEVEHAIKDKSERSSKLVLELCELLSKAYKSSKESLSKRITSSLQLN